MKFWAVLGSRGCREKKRVWADYEQLFWGVFFNFLWSKKKKKFENIVASALKSCIEKKVNFFLGSIFLVGKNIFYRANLILK